MTYVAMALLIAGTAFLLIAAIGIVRLPDPLQRMHSATKAGTLGATLMLLGVVIASDWSELSSTSGLTILFLLITLPIGAQLLGRASYVSGTRLQGLEEDPLAEELERQPGKPDEMTRDA
jgi:monovalent cation/proton antiporter, MnhG/PhaG subunit